MSLSKFRHKKTPKIGASQSYKPFILNPDEVCGGAGGIRTLEGITQHAFQACALSHSATAPLHYMHFHAIYIRCCI